MKKKNEVIFIVVLREGKVQVKVDVVKKTMFDKIIKLLRGT